MMKTGITGATGQLGGLLVDQLKQRGLGSDLVALVRSPEKAADLGIEARAFDYTKAPELEASLKGIDQLMLISGSEVGQRVSQHRNVIEAAKKAGVKSIVYTSLLHADTSSLILAGEHLETERMLRESGMDHTVLRNGWYTENYTASVPVALEGGAFVGSAGEGKISSATREDYAQAAAVVLSQGEHSGKTYELAGDQPYTLKELAQEISRQSGREIPYKNLPEAQYAELLASHGLPEGVARAVAGFDIGASRGDLHHTGGELSQLIGRPTTPLAEAIKRTIA